MSPVNVPNDGMIVAAAWNALVNDKPEDNIFNDYWLLNTLKKGESFMSVDGGDVITASLEYALNGTVGFYSDTETISTQRSEVFDRAEFAWKEVAGTVLQSELENGVVQGSAKKFDLLDGKLKNLRSTLDSVINTSLYSDGSGTGGKELGGLQLLISSTPTTGTVGSINAANFSFWRNQQASGAQSSSAFDNLRATMRSIYNSSSNGMSGKHPQYITTTQTVFQGFEGLLTVNERFTDKSSGDGGFKNEVLKFKASAISYDIAVPSGLMYMYHPQFLKLAYLKGHWYKMTGPIRPANQTVDIYQVSARCNLITTNRRMLGVVTAIT
jgi:hypothetical protein